MSFSALLFLLIIFQSFILYHKPLRKSMVCKKIAISPFFSPFSKKKAKNFSEYCTFLIKVQ